MIYVNISNKEIGFIQDKLERLGKGARMPIKKAINATARNARDSLYKSVRQNYTVKPGAFSKKDIQISNATTSGLSALLKLAGETPSLRKAFRTRANGKSKAAQAMILKSGSMKVLQLGGGELKAFVATMGNGGDKGAHTGIFQRVDNRYMNRGRVTDKGYDKMNTYKPHRLKNGRMTKGRQGIRQLFGPGKAKIAEVVFLNEGVQEGIGNDLREKLFHFVLEATGGMQ